MRRAAPLPFGEATVTKDDGGVLGSERGERRQAGSLAAARCAVVGDWAGPSGWPGCLPRTRFPFFFLNLFLLPFLVFVEIEKERVFGGIFL